MAMQNVLAGARPPAPGGGAPQAEGSGNPLLDMLMQVPPETTVGEFLAMVQSQGQGGGGAPQQAPRRPAGGGQTGGRMM